MSLAAYERDQCHSDISTGIHGQIIGCVNDVPVERRDRDHDMTTPPNSRGGWKSSS